jgi:septal ring factor EnvC (AmiA/AmiB activator)
MTGKPWGISLALLIGVGTAVPAVAAGVSDPATAESAAASSPAASSTDHDKVAARIANAYKALASLDANLQKDEADDAELQKELDETDSEIKALSARLAKLRATDAE